ncbi:class I SAM-dependent methyltransferase [Paenibacillus jiagnxiensis]|uniref:class I SAM-dependent methyltransferase n=1 Tax=Paenibacillus jiagnxiensis TaxID=3228926 RepID=UPI00339E9D51
MFSQYGELCTQVYNLTKPIGMSLGGDIEYYRERLSGVQGSVLEAAAGTGRVMVPLLEAGFLMEGMDSSPQMLEICQRACTERGFTPVLYNGRMEDISLPQSYAAIIIPGGSFLLLEHREHSLQALQAFYRHLQSGGKLLLDLFLQTEFRTGIVNTSTFPAADGAVITLEEKVVSVDWLNQCKISHLRYEKWKEGVLLQTELQYFPIQWFGMEEFKLMLKEAGFMDITISAGYRYNRKPDHAGQMITYEAVKP